MRGVTERLTALCGSPTFQLTRLMRGVTVKQRCQQHCILLFQLTRLMRGVTS